MNQIDQCTANTVREFSAMKQNTSTVAIAVAMFCERHVLDSMLMTSGGDLNAVQRGQRPARKDAFSHLLILAF